MKKIDLGQMVTILANLGVILGIVFLALELQQNTASIRGATYQSMSDTAVNQFQGVAEDTELAVALVRTFMGVRRSDLSLEEWAKLIYFYLAFIHQLENSFNQHQAGLVDDSVFSSYGWNTAIPNTPAFREYWFDFGRGVNTSSEEFIRFFEERFDLEPLPSVE